MNMDGTSLMVQFEASRAVIFWSVRGGAGPGKPESRDFSSRLELGRRRKHKANHKPGLSRQQWLHLDGSCTIQTKRRQTSSTSSSGRKRQYSVMSIMWRLASWDNLAALCIRTKQKRRFSSSLTIFPARQTSCWGRTSEVSSWFVPKWSHCVCHEFELRKEAIKLTRNCGMLFQAAPTAAWRNDEHRMEHWILLWTTANSGEKHFSQLLRASRSRSPRITWPQLQWARPALFQKLTSFRN